MKNILHIIALVFFLLVLFGWESELFASGTISGMITDSEINKPLAGVTIRLEGTALGATSNRDGHFFIPEAPSGTYTLLISLSGYKLNRRYLTIADGDTNFISVKLSSEPLQTSEIIVSANKHVQAAQDVPVSVSVVDQRAVQQRNLTKVDDILRYIPGLLINRDQVSIRGTSGFALGVGSRSLLLLDGFPMLSGEAGEMKFDALPVYELERIEVVKGAASSLYGTSAIGGVVNLITRNPNDYPEFRFRAYNGLYTVPRFEQWRYTQKQPQLFGFDASYSQKIGPVGWLISGGSKSDDSYREFDDSYRWNLYSKINFTPSSSTNLSVYSNLAYEDHANWSYWHSLQYATRPPEGTDLNERLRSNKMVVAGEFKQIIDESNFVVLRGGIFQTKHENNVGYDSKNYRLSDATAANAELQLNSRLNEKILFTYGGAFTRNDVKSSQYGEKGQYNFAFYGQTEFTNLENIIVTFGARLDAEKTFGEKNNLEFSPKLGISYTSALGPVLRMSLGRGFRVPMLAERFAAFPYNNFNVVQNLDLSPEKSWTFELRGNYNKQIFSHTWNFDLALFQNELYSLIEPVMPCDQVMAEGYIQFKNITRARIQGIEFAAKGWIGDKLIGVETSFTGMLSRDLGEQNVLKYRPSVLWYTHAFIPINFIEIHADYRFISRIERIDDCLAQFIRNAEERVPVHVVDARLMLNFERLNNIPIAITVNVKNIFDYYYSEIMGNLAPTRRLSIQFDTRF